MDDSDYKSQDKHSKSLLVNFCNFDIFRQFLLLTTNLLIKSKNCLKLSKLQKFTNKLIECIGSFSSQPAIKG